MKINRIITLFLMFVTVVTFGCKEKQEVKEVEPTANIVEQVVQEKISLISAEELNKLMATNPDIQILDVRTVEEVAEGKIAGSKNISVYEEEFAEMVKALDTTKPVYIYCKMGGRSADASKIVENMGFPQIYDLEGGITSWQEKGLPVVKE